MAEAPSPEPGGRAALAAFGLVRPRRVPLLRATAAARAGAAVHRRLRRPADPDLVVRLVAARDHRRAQPPRHASRLGAERGRPRLGEHGAGDLGRLRPADGARRAGCLLRRRRGVAARPVRVHGLPALPPPDAALLALAPGRLSLRLLRLRAPARARPAAADGRVRRPAARTRDRARLRRGDLEAAARNRARPAARPPALPRDRDRPDRDDHARGRAACSASRSRRRAAATSPRS